MEEKNFDNRISVLIENGIKLGHRTLFVIVGDNAKNQVVLLHHLMQRCSSKSRPSVLWCYKKDLGFATNRKKRMKKIQTKAKSGNLDTQNEDPFDLFLCATSIRFCHYADTQNILGNTYGVCVLQDFESLTPNLLARTIETVEGGGLVILLIKTLNSLKQLYNLKMDVHKHFQTEAHRNVTCRFNERFILSLASCQRCIVMNDQLTVLPITLHNLQITPVDQNACPNDNHLTELKENTKDKITGVLINQCVTLDQGNALLKFFDAITDKKLSTTVSLTAARGRGKSATLGLAVAAAVAYGYSNIFVTSPSPENLNTFFEFVCKGFDALKYEEHTDYTLSRLHDPDFKKCVVRIEINKNHRQTIQYIPPTDCDKLFQAELLVIDEAAAIPLPYVKAMLGSYLIFLASTINGYEGTGRSFSLKLLQQLRVQTVSNTESNFKNASSKVSSTNRTLQEISLKESIRYKSEDDIEDWLNKLLCLDATDTVQTASLFPPANECNLYYINRDTLFSYHGASEEFLQRLVSLYVSSHYKNSPNDLQMMSDAPAHHLFCLLGPVDPDQKTLPDVLVVIQVCLEGNISEKSASEVFKSGHMAAGDLIPWTVAQQFRDVGFTSLCGARIVRIATNPDYQKMGYGSRALNLLRQYYEFKFTNIDENGDESNVEESETNEEEIGLLNEQIFPRKCLSPLFLTLSERAPEKLSYLGVSFGLTEPLLKFWKLANFIPVYVRQTTNDITGEHSCIMLNFLKVKDSKLDFELFESYWEDFKRRFAALLSREFSKFPTTFAFNVIMNKTIKTKLKKLNSSEVGLYLTKRDMVRLKDYTNQLIDYHYILDLIPTLSRLYFFSQTNDIELSNIQISILVGIGFQNKSIETISTEFDLPVGQLLPLFSKLLKKFHQYLNCILDERDESCKKTEGKRTADVENTGNKHKKKKQKFKN